MREFEKRKSKRGVKRLARQSNASIYLFIEFSIKDRMRESNKYRMSKNSRNEMETLYTPL